MAFRRAGSQSTRSRGRKPSALEFGRFRRYQIQMPRSTSAKSQVGKLDSSPLCLHNSRQPNMRSQAQRYQLSGLEGRFTPALSFTIHSTGGKKGSGGKPPLPGLRIANIGHGNSIWVFQRMARRLLRPATPLPRSRMNGSCSCRTPAGCNVYSEAPKTKAVAAVLGWPSALQRGRRPVDIPQAAILRSPTERRTKPKPWQPIIKGSAKRRQQRSMFFHPFQDIRFGSDAITPVSDSAHPT